MKSNFKLSIFSFVISLFILSSITNYVYGFNIITVGDVDCKSTAKELVNDIVKKAADFYLWLGDLSYTETPEGDECFLDMLKNKEILDKSYIALGNHDLLNEKDYLNTFNLTKPYYSIDFNYKIEHYKNNLNIHLIVINTEEEILKNTEQYEWIENDLDKVWNNGKELYNYTLVASHRPIYGAKDVKPELGEGKSSSFQSLHPLFKSRGVDLVLSGHHHVYYRMVPLDGIQYITIGTGGAPQHHFFTADEKPKNIFIRFAGIHGFLNIDFSDKIYGTFLDIPDNNVLDSFSIQSN